MREIRKMRTLNMNTNRMRIAASSLFLLSFVTAATAAITKGPDAGGYTATDNVVFSFADISGAGGGTSVLATVDDGVAALNLPFAFNFYGSNYTTICASTNGILYFVTNATQCSGFTDFANADISANPTINDLPAVLPFWTDLSFAVPGSGAIYYQTIGTTAGTRRFVVQWNNAYPQAGQLSPSPVTFQVILSEGNNAITFQYQTVNLGTGNPASNGAQATIGIRNNGSVTASGANLGQQIVWSFDAPVLANGAAIQFATSTVPAAPVLVSPANNATNVASPATLTWNGSNGATSYDVYFGQTNPPALVTNQTGTTFTTPALTAGGTYFWKIGARNLSGATASAVNSFTTTPPNNPAPPPVSNVIPAVTWNTPASITYGTLLSAAQLNANANVAGTFAYSPAPGTLLNAGPQTLSVTFTPSNGSAPITTTVTITVLQANQSITFGPIPGHTTDEANFTLSATASSGLPITYTVISGPATIAGNTVTITGAGNITIQASQPGNANVAAAAPIRQTFYVNLGTLKISSVLNAASYANSALAADAYAVVFGSSFAIQPAQAGSLPLPTQLSGASISIKDSTGATAAANIYYASLTQINFLVPEGLASGAATLTVTNTLGKSVSYPVTIATSAPALFSGDASGQGSAAAVIIVVAGDGTATSFLSSSCSGSPVSCTPVQIDLSDPTKQVYVSLYGTGIRGAGQSAVSVTVGGQPATVSYAGPQPQYPGLDQVNVLLNPALAGSGTVTVQLSIGGTTANPVTIAIK